MKRNPGKIMALILSCVIALGLFASCELVAVDKDKDMAQVVASVNVDVYGQEENIYKRELVSGYVNYGYQYVVNYQWTVSKTYELILDNLVNNKVIVQYAKSVLKNVEGSYNANAEIALTKDSGDDVFNARVAYVKESVKYLTDTQIAEAVYGAHSTFNSILDSLDESIENETAEKEDETVEARTVPTVAAVDGDVVDEVYAEVNGLGENYLVEDLDEAAKADYEAWLKTKYSSYVLNGKPAVATTSARKKAFNEFVELFEGYGLIGEEEYSALEGEGKQYDITGYVYYLDVLASNIDSLIISNYEDYLSELSEGTITTEALWDEYVSAYNTQKAKYEKDLSAYEAALNGLTEDSFVLYNPVISGVKYGYVANILISFSDEASAALTAYKAKATSKSEITAYRSNLLNTVVAKDLRSSWLQNGYYEKDEAGNYAFGKDYVKTEAFKNFIGTYVDNTDYTETTTNYTYYHDGTNYVWGDKEEESYTASFANIVPEEISFISFVENYLSLIGNEMVISGATNAAQYDNYTGKIASFTASEEQLDLIDDILFTFGTDPGSLNNYLGYLYSPKTSATDYKKEFADGAKIAVEGGVGTFYFATTDFGIHVIICTRVVEAGDLYADEAAFTSDIETKGTTAYKFREAKKNANLETLVSDTVTYSIAKYIGEGSEAEKTIAKVEKALKDLIVEEEKK